MSKQSAKKLKNRKNPAKTLINRRASYDYHLSDNLEVGMALNGPEVRSLRDRRAQLKGSYVTIRNNELWLLGLTLGSESARDIKLLATKKQITALLREKADGLTIVPTKLLPTKRHIKLVIALGKGKKTYDKRHDIKKRDITREQQRYGA